MTALPSAARYFQSPHPFLLPPPLEAATTRAFPPSCYDSGTNKYNTVSAYVDNINCNLSIRTSF